jgi:hypothetical protein
MSDAPQGGENPAKVRTPQGSMFLYKQPEYLNREDHANLGWTSPAKPFAFAREIMSVPLVASEISSAQKHYPVIFTGKENAVPMAVLSVMKDRNIFVNVEGKWDSNSYIPSYLRRHPFAIAKGDGDQFAVVIDRSSAGITEDPTHPFFEGDVLSERTQSIVDFCATFEAERTRTAEFSAKLAELNLLSEQTASHPDKDGNPKQIASFFSVDMEKFSALPTEELASMHKSGFLSFIYAQLFSQENWSRLMLRSNAIIAQAANS